jgi:hypothetical protein
MALYGFCHHHNELSLGNRFSVYVVRNKTSSHQDIHFGVIPSANGHFRMVKFAWQVPACLAAACISTTSNFMHCLQHTWLCSFLFFNFEFINFCYVQSTIIQPSTWDTLVVQGLVRTR